MLNFMLSAVNIMAADEPTSWTTYLLWGVLGLLVILIFVWPMISNRKRGKQVNDMRSTLRLGDEIMTIGGIVGKVVEIRERSPHDKDFIIETGVGEHKSTMLFDLRALHENRTRMRELQEEAAKQAEIARLQKDAKRAGQLPPPQDTAETEPAQNQDATGDGNSQQK